MRVGGLPKIRGKGLTEPGALAALLNVRLAYRYAVADDALEVARITASMPEQNFVGLPLDYRRTLDELDGLAATYAMYYWRQVACCLTMSAGTLSAATGESANAGEVPR